LTLHEALGTTSADVACVNVVEELVGDEVVPRKPDQIGRKEQQRNSHASPKPRRPEVPARGSEDESDEKSGDEKYDRILGKQAESECRADRNPPTRILGFQQAYRAPRGQHPPEDSKRSVLKFGGFEYRHRREADGEGGGDLCEAISAQVTRHETGEDDDSGLGEH
jgi:hypothetical protein